MHRVVFYDENINVTLSLADIAQLRRAAPFQPPTLRLSRQIRKRYPVTRPKVSIQCDDLSHSGV
jgi:hypothetical protein